MKLLLCGDIMMGENLFHLGRGISSNYKGKYAELVSSDILGELTREAEMFLFNFEFSLYQNELSSYRNTVDRIYRGEIGTLDLLLKFNGLKVANVANNHFSQHGVDSAKFTCETLTLHDINVIGMNRDAIQFMDNNGKLLKVWGVSLIEDPFYCNSYWLSTPEKLITFIQNQKKPDNEYWIISIHWGDEYIEQPSPEQVELAHSLVNQGVDLIIGHHPHVIQSIEVYKEKTIFYSFGNFIFDQNFSAETTTGLVALFDTNSNSITKLYKTGQKHYAVASLMEVVPEEFLLKNDFDYLGTLLNNQRNFRKAMKTEYIKKIHRTSPEVFLHLLKKIMK